LVSISSNQNAAHDSVAFAGSASTVLNPESAAGSDPDEVLGPERPDVPVSPKSAAKPPDCAEVVRDVMPRTGEGVVALEREAMLLEGLT
jgi:hypothetical protein